jgi:hypothetical protein
MSLSFKARTRLQSVLEVFEEDRFFISGGSSKRDDMNLLECLGVNDGNRHPSEEPERHEALLRIVESVVFECESWTLKYPQCINDVETMSFQIRPTFPFVPRDAHRRSVYTA